MGSTPTFGTSNDPEGDLVIQLIQFNSNGPGSHLAAK